MSKSTFEERYQDVLQNIEYAIILVYRARPELTDWDALTAIEALIRTYRAEAVGRTLKIPTLKALPQEVYQTTKAMCEWRLGRETLFKQDGEPLGEMLPVIPLGKMVACLKRIRKSINLWTRQGGRQGYLNYVNEFIL